MAALVNPNSRNLNTIRNHLLQFVEEMVGIDSRAEFGSPLTHFPRTDQTLSERLIFSLRLTLGAVETKL